MRQTFLPFAKPSIGDAEIAEVSDSLRSGWLTTGPKTERFTEEFRARVGGRFAAAISSATAGLHVALLAHGVGAGDEVITTPMTFAATLNVIVLAGAIPVLADIDRDTLNVRVEEIEKKIGPRTRAIIPVHYVGQPCDWTRSWYSRRGTASRSSRTPPTRSGRSTGEGGSARSRRRPSSRSTRTRTSRRARAAWS